MNLRLVKFYAKDGFPIFGAFVPPIHASKPVVVHIHGKCGNFYQNDFLRHILESSVSTSCFGILAINTRGHDCLAESLTHGHVKYVGGSIEDPDLSLMDVEAAVNFAKGYSPSVILQGHSMGAELAATYTCSFDHEIENAVDGLIFLSPCNSVAMQTEYLGKPLEEQKVNIYTTKENASLDLRTDIYGIQAGDVTYSIPVSLEGFIDTLGSKVIRAFSCTTDRREKVTQPCLAVFGERDPLAKLTRMDVERAMSAKFRHCQSVEITFADHQFRGVEEELFETVRGWVDNVFSK